MTTATGPRTSAPRFVTEAEDFESRWGRDLAFRLLKRLLRCSDDDLSLIVKKIHSMSTSANTHEPREPLPRAYAALVLLPFALEARRRLSGPPPPASNGIWKPSTPPISANGSPSFTRGFPEASA